MKYYFKIKKQYNIQKSTTQRPNVPPESTTQQGEPGELAGLSKENLNGLEILKAAEQGKPMPQIIQKVKEATRQDPFDIPEGVI